MKDILDTPERNLSIHELELQVKEELSDFLKFNSDKKEIFLLLKKKYGSKNHDLILEILVNFASDEDRARSKTLKWTMIGLLVVSCLISVYLFFQYAAPRAGETFNWFILGQVLVSGFLIFEVVRFSRKIFSLIQILNAGKILLILANIVNGFYPEFVSGYFLLLGAIYIVAFYIKRIAFDRYRKILSTL